MLFLLDGVSSLAGRLDVGLVVASNPIANGYKIEFFGIKYVVMTGRHIHEALRQPIVVLLLFGRVVESRMTQILIPTGNQKLFQLLQVETK